MKITENFKHWMRRFIIGKNQRNNIDENDDKNRLAQKLIMILKCFVQICFSDSSESVFEKMGSFGIFNDHKHDMIKSIALIVVQKIAHFFYGFSDFDQWNPFFNDIIIDGSVKTEWWQI